MKRNLIKVLTTILIIVMMLPYFSFADGVIFNDIEGSYAKEEIEALHKANILQGTGAGKFNPIGTMDRAQLSTVLVRVLNLKQDKGSAKKFTDISQDSWYAGYVGAIAETGITVGTSVNTFSPNRKVTKQELAVFYIRALGLEEKAKEMNISLELSDRGKVADWAKESVGLAIYLGLVPSISNNDGSFRFEPTVEVNRELLASITYRLFNNKAMYYTMLDMGNVIGRPVDSLKPTEPIKPGPERPVDPVRPVEPVKPDPTKPGDPKPTEPADPKPTEPADPKPTEPVDPKPTEPVDPKPTEPVDPKPTEPVDPKPTEPEVPPIEDEGFKLENVTGKQVEFMGAYLISVEFDLIGNISRKDVKIIINDGLTNAMKIKEGTPEKFDYYFDGIVSSIDNIILYIGEEKIDLTNRINWR